MVRKIKISDNGKVLCPKPNYDKELLKEHMELAANRNSGNKLSKQQESWLFELVRFQYDIIVLNNVIYLLMVHLLLHQLVEDLV